MRPGGVGRGEGGGVTLAAVVLAAGEGKRLASDRAKVLHRVGGRALLDHVLAALAPLAPDHLVVVTGHRRRQVEDHLGSRARTVVQDPPRGTGDAVALALRELPAEGDVLVLSGDVPLIRSLTLVELVERRRRAHAAAALATAVLPDGGAYGRIVRDAAGDVTAIVEARDAGEAERAIREVNAGTYAFSTVDLLDVIGEVQADNAQGEYYLTDAVRLLVDRGRKVIALKLSDADEMAGVNSRADLAEVARLLVRRVIAELQGAGVTVLDPASTWVEPGCRVGRDTVLEPGVHLRDGCVIGARCVIGANSVLDGVTVPDDVEVAPLSRRWP